MVKHLSLVRLLLNSNFFSSVNWTYECQHQKCNRVEFVQVKKLMSLSECRMFCGEDPGMLWPRVNGHIKIERPLIRLNLREIYFEFYNKSRAHDQFWLQNEKRFLEQLYQKTKHSSNAIDHGSPLSIYIHVKNQSVHLGLNTNEHYHIRAQTKRYNGISANITAESIFGARHALETISQLIIFDDIRNELQMVGDFEIDDRPAFPHRGFVLDTVRNYFSIDSIKRTIGEDFEIWMQIKIFF